MKKIRLVFNSDRVHVSVDDVPAATFVFEYNKGKKEAMQLAQAFAYNLILDYQAAGFQVKVLPNLNLF